MRAVMKGIVCWGRDECSVTMVPRTKNRVSSWSTTKPRGSKTVKYPRICLLYVRSEQEEEEEQEGGGGRRRRRRRKRKKKKEAANGPHLQTSDLPVFGMDVQRQPKKKIQSVTFCIKAQKISRYFHNGTYQALTGSLPLPLIATPISPMPNPPVVFVCPCKSTPREMASSMADLAKNVLLISKILILNETKKRNETKRKNKCNRMFCQTLQLANWSS